MAILATQKVLTYDNWKLASKLKQGDYVFNKEGKLVEIKLIQQYFSENCYEIIFDDLLTIAGDKHLGFLVENKKYRKRLDEYKGVQKKFRRPLIFTKVEDLLDLSLKDKRNRSEYSIPTTKPLEFPHQSLPIPPFIFGFWFFNRNSKNNLLPIAGTANYIHERFKNCGYKIKEQWRAHNGEKLFTVSPTIESQFAPRIPNRLPDSYLLASVEERNELLSGIMYSKARQYSLQKDTFRFTSQSYNEVKQIQGLVESLGSRTRMVFDEYNKYYTLIFRHRLKIMEMQESPPVKVHFGRRYIKEIEPIQSQMCVHIETSGTDNSVLVGEGFIQAC